MLAACGSGSNGMSVRSQSLEQIVGGQDAVGTEAFASTVASLGDKFGPFCTVSLISENIALTAAHCLSEQPKNLVLFFGIEPTISGPSGRTFRQVDSYEVSPFWKAKTAQEIDFGDIAVIHF
ncbi:MAG: trypsin-like serine protease, partial [Bdellovibrionota bacterium]